MRLKRNGVVEQDLLTDMGRVMGRVQTGGNDGSINVPGLLLGYPIFPAVSLGAPTQRVPNVSVSGQTLSWSYPAAQAGTTHGKADCIILYGTRALPYGAGSYSPPTESSRWGFRIRHPQSGAVIIDDKYSNLAFRQKVSLTTGAIVAGGASTVSFTYSSPTMPMVAITCSKPTTLWSVARSGNNWTFQFYAQGASATITAYVFDDPAALGAGWGARIRSGATIRYDSRHKYARPVNRLAGSSGAPNAAIAAGKTYAVAPGRFTGEFRSEVMPWEGGNWDQTVTTEAMGVSFSGNQITSALVQLFAASSSGSGTLPPAWLYQYPTYEWLVLDVTGL